MSRELVLYGWVILANVLAVFVTAFDKWAAKSRRFRVPENTLLLLAAVGGSGAMLLTMWLIRHKTRRAKFMLGLPAIILLQGAALVLLYMYIKNGLNPAV